MHRYTHLPPFHPNVIRIYAILRDPLTAEQWIFMERADATLKALKADLSLTDAVRLIEDVLLGLHFLHHLNPPIIHGDIKADNILLVKVCIVMLRSLSATVGSSKDRRL